MLFTHRSMQIDTCSHACPRSGGGDGHTNIGCTREDNVIVICKSYRIYRSFETVFLPYRLHVSAAQKKSTSLPHCVQERVDGPSASEPFINECAAKNRKTKPLNTTIQSMRKLKKKTTTEPFETFNAKQYNGRKARIRRNRPPATLSRRPTRKLTHRSR